MVAGSELAHGFSKWNWSDLTVGAVADRAGVDVRTVYRHFANERELRDAVMRRLEEEAGVTVEELRLEDFADVTARVYAQLELLRHRAQAGRRPHVRRHRPAPARGAAGRGRTVDRGVVRQADREVAAAVLDLLWTVPTYERMRSAWQFDPAEATRAARWVIELVRRALDEGTAAVPPRSG